MAEAQTENHYLSGNFAPLTKEVKASDLAITGALPKELNGRYMRIGPNPRGDIDPAMYHWFMGDGMVHGIRLRDGKAEWYRSRFVDIDGFSPNTNVLAHSGRILALREMGMPCVELTPELDGMTVWDFEGEFRRGSTAHPKTDPVTGDLHAINTAIGKSGYMARYVVIDRAGTTTHSTEIHVEDMPLIHDMALTETRVVVLDLPVTMGAGLRRMNEGLPVTQGLMTWDDQHPARVGIMLIRGTAQDITWVEVPQCYVFHVLNAYDNADGSLTLDVVRYDENFQQDLYGPGGTVPILVRWTVNPTTGNVNEQVMGDWSVEFPRIDATLVGRPHRYGYFAGVGAHGIEVSSEDVKRARSMGGFEVGPLVKVDTVAGSSVPYDFGPGRVTGEPEFIARPNAESEDDGWIMSIVHDANTDRGELVILDAADIAAGPVARVHLPTRVPFGFHGNWISDTQLA
ncbi:carotenoid oxygenase family protein [Streptomyces massasporeus]|uniref:carotenoid oxygenase family protein n=1 Tax=Streptomyces massasporeus TaxID=67324 RepID=UPI0033F97A45